MDKPKAAIATYDLVLASDVMEIADALGSGWVFRGQADTDWLLSSSLEREVGRICNPDPTRWLEESVQAEFEKVALKKVRDERPTFAGLTSETDHFSWLAWLQHHGCKTRLIDFTDSFYVALHFAVSGQPTTDAVVWALATRQIDQHTQSLCNQCNEKLTPDEIRRQLVNNSIDLPYRYVVDDVKDDRLAVVYGKPQQLNQRLIAQQGLFVCALNLKKTFMENLAVGVGITADSETAISELESLKTAAKRMTAIRIRIPRSEHPSLLSHLRRMNITDATLFPGPDGYARNLNQHIGD